MQLDLMREIYNFHVTSTYQIHTKSIIMSDFIEILSKLLLMLGTEFKSKLALVVLN